ncbi:imidazolonepropionase-like domain-containing protein [Streptomyces sp. NPDC086080]|uniref:imidazolonepropionase-like domain-containing protein n=1 Tax=Streptomyces sp. NPDC086080 TaxID=3365748 RepID=UPI0037D86442
MLTIHAADLLLPGGRRSALPDGAVLVDGRELAAVGPYGELAAAHPAARIRRWPGVLMPGLVNPYGPELLEQAYHPDPNEADELGTEPLTGEALARLEMTGVRWGESARRGVQRLLAHGVVAVAGDLWRPAAVAAVTRAGLSVEERFGDPDGPAVFDPLAGRSPAEAMLLPLPVDGEKGGEATFAVFDVPDEAALAERGAGTCLATVVAGRLVHRRR